MAEPRLEPTLLTSILYSRPWSGEIKSPDCQFLWYQYSHRGPLPAAQVPSLNADVGVTAQKQAIVPHFYLTEGAKNHQCKDESVVK